MAQIKISELEQLTELTDNDVIVGVDTETTTTKKIDMSTVKTYTNQEQDEEINNNKSSIRRLENNIFEAGEATGESINIQDSVLSELTGFRAKAVNTQVIGEDIPSPTNPSPIPVMEAGEVVEVKSVGDNTFKFAEINSGHSGLTFKTNADGSFTINGTATIQGSVQALFSTSFPNVKKGDILGVKVLSGSVTSTANNIKPRLVMFDEKYDKNLKIDNLNKMSAGSFKYANAYADFVPALWYIDWNAGDVFDNFTIQGFYSRSGKTEYEPYVESNLTTSVPEGEFVGATDTTADEFYTEYNEEDKKEHIYLAKNVGRRVLDGTENWSIQQSGTDTYFYQLYVGAKTLANASCISSHYTTNFIATTNTNEGIYNTTEAFRVRYGTEKTLEEWKAQLVDNNVTVLYGLVNPYVIDLGAIDQLKTWTDVTNILNNSSIPFEMTANYYRNFISTIRNLQVNNGALQTELANLESRLSTLETSVSNIQTSQVNESEVAEDVI